MTMSDQIFAQTLLMAGPVEEGEQELLASLCELAQLQLRSRLRPGITPEDCRADFAAAAGLYALAEFDEIRRQREPVSMTLGDVTLRRTSQDPAVTCLRIQADMIMSSFLKDRFAFARV